jgi:hypothetical protein
MKMEIIVPDELAEKFGAEALHAYIVRKLDRLQELLSENRAELADDEARYTGDPDENRSQSWANFGKGRPAC